MALKAMGMLVDITSCTACGQCVQACMKSHGVEGGKEPVRDLSDRARTCVVEKGDVGVRNMCRHCLTPSCASVCPVGALKKDERGPVTYDADKCIGCRYCMLACPFNIPRYQWHERVPALVKCDMCVDRLDKGEKPACVEACPNEAVTFGPREELLRVAHKRIMDNPSGYYDHVYGEHEIGGTSVLFLSPEPLEMLGYRAQLGLEPLPDLTMAQVKRVPGIVVAGGAALMAIWWLTRRRDEVAAAEGRGRGGISADLGGGNGRHGHDR